MHCQVVFTTSFQVANNAGNNTDRGDTMTTTITRNGKPLTGGNGETWQLNELELAAIRWHWRRDALFEAASVRLDRRVALLALPQLMADTMRQVAEMQTYPHRVTTGVIWRDVR